MKIINIILLAILILEIVALILFHIKYIAQFNFRNFMSTLYDKMNLTEEYELREEYEHREKYKKYEKYEAVFNKYYDNASLGFAISTATSLFVMILTIIALIFLVIWQFCGKCKNCKKCCDFFFPIYCLLNMIIYLYFAFSAKYKVDIPENEIYVYDEEFNKELKKNLDFMYERKIYLIVCVFVAIAGIITQFILILIYRKNESVIINNMQPQYFYSQPNIQQNNNLGVQQANNINAQVNINQDKIEETY